MYPLMYPFGLAVGGLPWASADHRGEEKSYGLNDLLRLLDVPGTPWIVQVERELKTKFHISTAEYPWADLRNVADEYCIEF